MFNYKELHNAFIRHSVGATMDDLHVSLNGICTQMTRLLFETNNKLRLTDCKVYMNLLQRCSIKRKIYFSFPSYKTLKTHTGLQNNQIAKSLSKLQSLGLILILKNFKGPTRKYSNLYIIMDLMASNKYDLPYLMAINDINKFKMSTQELYNVYYEQKSVFLSFKKQLLKQLENRKYPEIEKQKEREKSDTEFLKKIQREIAETVKNNKQESGNNYVPEEDFEECEE